MQPAATPKPVRLLSEALANQIAAGEVVERPASVLKELCENSLDAGAERLTIEVTGAGRRLIRVVDNGWGMTPDDLLMALERHATSKLDQEQDLEAVATLGFRGEALPSIAAVSKILLRSRTHQAETGCQVRAVGGVIRQVEEVGCPPGTVVEVRDLFFNTPARRKFLKSRITENGHLGETVLRLALARPQVAVRYSNGGKLIWDLPPEKDTAARAAALLGREAAAQMVPLNQDAGVFHLGGLAGLPSLSRRAADQIYTFVNGRYVRDRVLLHAVAEAYRGILPEGRRPVVVLYLEMDPALVDVNVHPAKTEVRFRRQKEVHDGLVQALRQGLARQPETTRHPAPPAPAPKPTPSAAPRPLGPASGPAPGGPRAEAMPPPPAGEDTPAGGAPLGGPRPGARALFGPAGELSVLGQLHGLYIVCASPQGLVIVDQHAAHERLNYEEMKRSLRRGPLASQGLLTPATLELSPQEAAWAQAQAGDWGRLGLEISPFGGNTWMIAAVPAVLAGRDPVPVVRDLLSELSAAGVPAGTPEFLEVALRSLACRSSLKSGQRLERRELEDLVQRAAALPPPVTCPHGRPVFLTISSQELARHFKRSGG